MSQETYVSPDPEAKREALLVIDWSRKNPGKEEEESCKIKEQIAEEKEDGGKFIVKFQSYFLLFKGFRDKVKLIW